MVDAIQRDALNGVIGAVGSDTRAYRNQQGQEYDSDHNPAYQAIGLALARLLHTAHPAPAYRALRYDRPLIKSADGDMFLARAWQSGGQQPLIYNQATTGRGRQLRHVEFPTILIRYIRQWRMRLHSCMTIHPIPRAHFLEAGNVRHII